MEKNYNNGVIDMSDKRFALVPGIGIEDTQTGDIYVTLLEIVHLLNKYAEEQWTSPNY